MLLAIDIGNTNIVIGGIRENNVVFKARIATDYLKTSDQYGVEIMNMLSAFGIHREDISDCIISSVVPPVFHSVNTGVIKVIGKKPMVVGPGLKSGLDIHTDIPSQVGSDMIVTSVAALERYTAPLILIDMGTATTVQVLEPKNVFIGGMILPGVKVSLDSLTGRTAQLPGISLEKPKSVVGRNTVECMRSGIMYGTASMLDGIIDRITQEQGHPYTVVATGGLAQFIVPLCTHEIALEKDLLLEGLNLIYKKNKKS